MSSRLFDDANNEYLEFTGYTEVTAAPFTMLAWAKSDVTNINQAIMSIGDTGGNVNYWQMYFSSNMKAAVIASDSGGSQVTATSSSASSDTWHHVSVVITSATDRVVRLDVAGSATGTDDISPAGSDAVRLGMRVNSVASTNPFSGEIDEAMVIDLALTSAELTNIKDGFMPRRIRPKNVRSQWRTGRDSPEKDVSFKSNDLVLQNSPAVSSASPPTRIKPFDRNHRNRSRGMRRQIAKGTSTGGFDP